MGVRLRRIVGAVCCGGPRRAARARHVNGLFTIPTDTAARPCFWGFAQAETAFPRGTDFPLPIGRAHLVNQ